MVRDDITLCELRLLQSSREQRSLLRDAVGVLGEYVSPSFAVPQFQFWLLIVQDTEIKCTVDSAN
jgi:hypothetical protein